MKFLIAIALLTFIVFNPVQAPAQEQDGGAAPHQQQDSQIDYSAIPDEYLEEADAFFAECGTSTRFKNYYDCECLTVKYLDERIKSGPNKPKSAILVNIGKECADATYAAGKSFNDCLNMGPLLPVQGGDALGFCECYANTYANLYESFRVSPNSKTFQALQTQAMTACANPALARELYSTRRPNR